MAGLNWKYSSTFVNLNALLWHNFSIFPCNLKEIVRKKGMG
jgi:hypothetical protein